jgi:cell division transport system permease protein
MELPLQPKPAERRLLQEGRLAGPMPWVIAIMMFLTVLSAAAGLAVAESARAMGQDLAGRLTIQLAEANPVTRESQKQAIMRDLGQLSNVLASNVVPSAELTAMLDPWLGEGGLDNDLPIPALIDVELRRATPADIESIRQSVKAVAPNARVNEHLAWLAPLAGLLASLKWLAVGVVVLMAIATAATVVLAARAALNTHKATIEVMHLLGSTDSQVAGLFQRRIALDALLGGAIGLLLAMGVILMIGGRMRALGSGVLGAGGLGWSDWVIIALLPMLGVALATVSARLTVLNALRRTL